MDYCPSCGAATWKDDVREYSECRICGDKQASCRYCGYMLDYCPCETYEEQGGPTAPDQYDDPEAALDAALKLLEAS